MEGHTLFSKSLQDLSFGGVVRWKLLTAEVYFQFAKYVALGLGGSDDMSSMWPYLMVLLQARSKMSDYFLNAL